MRTNGPIRFYRHKKNKVVSLDKELTTLEDQILSVENQLESEIARVDNRIDDVETELSLKQNITDSNLNTNAKTIVEAINELEARPIMPPVDSETIIINGNQELQAIAIKSGDIIIDVDYITNLEENITQEFNTTKPRITDVENKNTEQDAALEALNLRISGLEGKGVPLPPNDFQVNNPSINDLNEYAIGILNEWGLINSTNPIDIPSGTFVVNIHNGHQWTLVNIPPLFQWTDDGVSGTATATNKSLGVVKGSDEPYKIGIDAFGEMYVNDLTDTLNDIIDSVTNIQNITDVIVTDGDGTKALLDDGTYGITGKVDDVKVNGVSVVVGKVAEITIQNYLEGFITEDF